MPGKLSLCLTTLILAAGIQITPALGARASAEAKLIDLSGRIAGYARFRQMARGVMVEIFARGLKPGAHAVMIHTSAACDPKKGFYTAGPDLDFTPPRPHGFRVTGGPRPGDLPNQYAGADGVLHADLFTTYFTLGNGKRSLFDRDGASIILHEKGDDYLSAPDGKSGRRLVCGTIIRTQNGTARHRKKPHS